MIKSETKVVLTFVAVFIAFIAYNSVFILHETEQVIVLQFGKAKRTEITAGLKFKIPLIQNLEYYDKRLLDLDPPVEEVILADQKRLKVDSFTRFRIIDPLKFYQTAATENIARARLGDIINSSLREVLGNKTLKDLLSAERILIMDSISEKVSKQAENLGVEVAKVRIRRADLPEQVSQAINARMRSEREREAMEFRSEGQEMAQRIKSVADRDRTVLLAEAQKNAQIIRGEGDKMATKIWADAANKDKEFYNFYRSLEAYKTALEREGTSMILSPDSDFFRFFSKPIGIK